MGRGRLRQYEFGSDGLLRMLMRPAVGRWQRMTAVRETRRGVLCAAPVALRGRSRVTRIGIGFGDCMRPLL